MRQQVVLLPRPAPNSIIPTTPQRAPSSATMVVAMPVSDARRKVSLNHNLTGCDRHTAAHPAVTVRLMTYIGPGIFPACKMQEAPQGRCRSKGNAAVDQQQVSNQGGRGSASSLSER